MKTLFMSQDVWDLVENGFDEPPVEKDQLKELKKMDAKALLFIQQGVGNNIFPRIMRASKAKEAWDILQQEFQGDKRTRSVKLQALRRELENMKMKENETLNEFSSKFMELVNQMKSYGEEISDKRIVEKLLISLPSKFDPIVAVIEETKDLSLLSAQELFGSLKTYEQRLLRHSEKSVESAFQSKISLNSRNVERKPISNENRSDSSRGGRTGRGRARGRDGRGRGRFSYGRKFTNEEGSSFSKCNICKRSSHVEKDCWFKGKPQCFNCKKYRHVQKDCKFKNKQQATSKLC